MKCAWLQGEGLPGPPETAGEVPGWARSKVSLGCDSRHLGPNADQRRHCAAFLIRIHACQETEDAPYAHAGTRSDVRTGAACQSPFQRSYHNHDIRGLPAMCVHRQPGVDSFEGLCGLAPICDRFTQPAQAFQIHLGF